jgi:hypothetical protein
MSFQGPLSKRIRLGRGKKGLAHHESLTVEIFLRRHHGVQYGYPAGGPLAPAAHLRRRGHPAVHSGGAPGVRHGTRGGRDPAPGSHPGVRHGTRGGRDPAPGPHSRVRHGTRGGRDPAPGHHPGEHSLPAYNTGAKVRRRISVLWIYVYKDFSGSDLIKKQIKTFEDKTKNKNVRQNVQCCGSEMFIPDPGS